MRFSDIKQARLVTKTGQFLLQEQGALRAIPSAIRRAIRHDILENSARELQNS